MSKHFHLPLHPLISTKDAKYYKFFIKLIKNIIFEKVLIHQPEYIPWVNFLRLKTVIFL